MIIIFDFFSKLLILVVKSIRNKLKSLKNDLPNRVKMKNNFEMKWEPFSKNLPMRNKSLKSP